MQLSHPLLSAATSITTTTPPKILAMHQRQVCSSKVVHLSYADPQTTGCLLGRGPINPFQGSCRAPSCSARLSAYKAVFLLTLHPERETCYF